MTRELNICVQCGENPAVAKGLCAKCYRQHYKKIISNSLDINTHDKIDRLFSINESEMTFVKKFFKHGNWVFHPVRFNLESDIYTPDFYDAERNIFIEVVGSRQAYECSKHKYIKLRELFPKIVLEFRNRDGELCRKEDGSKIRNIKENNDIQDCEK